MNASNRENGQPGIVSVIRQRYLHHSDWVTPRLETEMLWAIELRSRGIVDDELLNDDTENLLVTTELLMEDEYFSEDEF